MRIFPQRDELEDWLVWGGGPVAMLISAIVTLGVTVFLCGLTAMHIDDRSLRSMPAYFQDATNLFGVIGAAGIVTLYYSMWFYWREIDESKRRKKRLWFFVLLLGLWYDSCLYYYFVYRLQVIALRKQASN